ncbi:MAG: hypothetical protein WAK96_11415, partial [Desulfobaccales bacterium]
MGYYTSALFKNTNISAPWCWAGGKGENHFSGFSSWRLFLRGWGGVFSILRRISSGLRGGSSFWRDESGFIGKPSEGKETDKTYKTKAQLLLQKTRD